MKFLIFAMTCFWFIGCAGLSVPESDQYPFRAGFEAVAVIGGETHRADGGMFITSGTTGIAEIYAPSGLSAFTLHLKDGVLRVLDTWGREMNRYRVPLKDIAGLVAGTPPGGAFLFKKRYRESLKVTYTWGYLLVDKDLLPKEIHMRTEPSLDAVFTVDGDILTLLILYGSDTLHLSIEIQEGGRWRF
ncbi:MAG TPA: hypothetical protein PLM29_03720 [Deltaproteobacteria bacterium]|nr:hypothetical protein [Deltaproteobacteria bacterium]